MASIFRSAYESGSLFDRPEWQTNILFHVASARTHGRPGHRDGELEVDGGYPLYRGLIPRRCLVFFITRDIISRLRSPRAVIPFRSCPIKLSIKIAEQDKHAMLETSIARREKIEQELSYTNEEEYLPTSLPPLKYSTNEEDGWTTFDKPLLYLYAGKGPYVGRFVVQHFLSRSPVLT
jgi:hypothetical protein